MKDKRHWTGLFKVASSSANPRWFLKDKPSKPRGRKRRKRKRRRLRLPQLRLPEINLDFLKKLVQHYPLPRIDKAGTGYIGRDGVKVPKTIINKKSKKIKK